MDSWIARLLARQHGVATVHQLVRDATVTPGQVRGWVRRGRLANPARGVVMAAGAPMTPEAEAMVAVLRAGWGARLVGPRVLALLGIRGFAREDAFGVLVPASRRLPTGTDFPVFRDPVPDDGTVRADGLPVPHPSRGMVEIARFLRGDPLLGAVDAGRWAGRPDGESLVAAAFALPRTYVPAARIRDLVRDGHLELESGPERRMVAILGDEFGPIETQVWVSPRRRVDALARRHHLAFEYQGQDHRTAAGRRADRVRDDELRALGLVPVHVFAEDLTHPVALRQRIRRILAHAEPRRRRAG